MRSVRPLNPAGIAGAGLWALVIAAPVVLLVFKAIAAAGEVEISSVISVDVAHCFIAAAVIAAAAVVLGWFPARLLGGSSKAAAIVLVLLLMPLMLPRYVLYYCWTLLLSPTTQLGAYLSSRPAAAKATAAGISWFVLMTSHWSLAAMVMAQGWRNIDGRIQDMARLEASWSRRLTKVTLPLMGRSVLLAWGCCFVLVLSEFGTFHLAGVRTFGTELAVLYQLTGSAGAVALAAWPVAATAAVVAVAAGALCRQWFVSDSVCPSPGGAASKGYWVVLIVLVAMTCGVPVLILLASVEGTVEFSRFWRLHLDELGWSLLVAAVTASLAHLVGWTAATVGRCGADCSDNGSRGVGRAAFGFLMRFSVLLVMFVPASLIAGGLLEMLAESGVSASVRQGWYIVSLGQVGRFAALAMIVFLLTRYPDRRRLSEMAQLDGAGPWRTWTQVHWPRLWPALAGSFLLVMALSLTELSATMVLLPAGLPNFAQRLLNQMHYARDQQVIASCLILICVLTGLSAAVVFLLSTASRRRMAVWVLSLTIAVTVCGCNRGSGDGPQVTGSFGRTGSGNGEFLYPRAIDRDPAGELFVVDKTGRIQCFDSQGVFQSLFEMPEIESGKPTGLTLGPEGRLYVADTHYHRVLIFDRGGGVAGQFGSFGRDEGCFIYPTDVEIGPDGRIYVGEYGGNDRISVFDGQWRFLFSFGSPGSDEGQFSRPSALCSDPKRGVLYVADACNHRIGVYDYEGRLQRYIGSLGVEAGQIRYPYDLTLLDDGTLVVCEYGNNRIQLFDPSGESLAVYGRAGREPGELAYPWGVATDGGSSLFVVDAGNNRVQVWQL